MTGPPPPPPTPTPPPDAPPPVPGSGTDPRWSAPEDHRPGAELRVPVSIGDGLALVLWSLLGQVLVATTAVVAFQLAGVDMQGLGGPSLGALTVVTQSLVLAGALAWLAGRGRVSWRLFGGAAPAVRHVGQGLLGGLGAFALTVTISLVADALLGPLEGPGQALLETEMLAGPALAFTVVAVCLLAPLLEELTFRGVLFQAIGRRSTWGVGALLSSLAFSVVHLEVLIPLRMESAVFGFALFAVGMVFALVFHRSRSLLAAVVAHATFNGVQIAIAVLVPGEAVAGFVGTLPGA